MLDKYLCRKFKLGKITLADIVAVILDNAMYKEIMTIVGLFLTACLMCSIAKVGMMVILGMLIKGCIFSLVGTIIVVCTFDKVTVATCPLRKVEN